MPGRSYANFDLLIEKSGEAYRARVQQSPAGEGDAEFQLPFSAAEIQALLPRLAWSRRRSRHMRPPPVRTEEIKHFGERLFLSVFTGNVETRFRHSLDLTASPEKGLRLRLRFHGVPELAHLPWEYLYDPQRGYLGISEETPIVRYPELPRPVQPLQVALPLHVLVVIANPLGTAPLDAEEEWSQIQRALADLTSRGLLLLECLTSPTLEELCVRLRQEPCHVLHFIGHGVFDRDQGFLVFSDTNGQPQRVSGEDLMVALRPQRISLAVLNACEGARRGESDAFAGVAQALVQSEIPAVVAMQSEISDKAAVSFAGHFYQLLAEYFPVDGALSETRKAMHSAGHKVEWGTPSLYMRSPDGQLFAPPAPPEEPPPPRRRHRWAFAGGLLTLVVLAVVSGEIFHARQEPALRPAPQTVQEPPPEPQRESGKEPGAPSSEPRKIPSSPSPPPAPAPKSSLPPSPPECPSPPGTDIRFVRIPAGSFMMGSGRKGEKPIHKVEITRPFCMGQYEITQQQWEQVMRGNSAQSSDGLPKTEITWDEVNEFIEVLNRVGKSRYRLPYEAEWEYAARAETTTRYTFGADPSELYLYGNCLSRSGHDDEFEKLAPVGRFRPNPWGLYDMYGNAWEWVEDWYSEEYAEGPAVDPAGPSVGTKRVRRGGAYDSSAAHCSSFYRSGWLPGKPAKNLGFRLVETIDQ